jgi:hypothetical protein
MPPTGNVRITGATNGTPGEIRGRATDGQGAVLPGVTILLEAGQVRRNAITDANGMFAISNVPAGYVTISAQLAGFTSASGAFVFDQQPRHVEFLLPIAGVTETVTVTGQSQAATVAHDRVMRRETDTQQQTAAPSQNVINLQRRTAGVLPVRIDVPRAGTSHEFVKPLVVDQETAVTFRYARR